MKGVYIIIAIGVFLTSFSCSKKSVTPDDEELQGKPDNEIVWQIDKAFNPTGTFVKYVQPLSSGKYIVANDTEMGRINNDGSRDDTFPNYQVTDGEIGAITVLKNGKILVVGSFNSFNGTNRRLVVRLNSDGSIDGNYPNIEDRYYFITASGDRNLSFKKYYNVSVRELSNGKIMISGNLRIGAKPQVPGWDNGEYYEGLVRLNADGSVDESFQKLDDIDAENSLGNGGIGGYIPALEDAGDGKLYVAGGIFNIGNNYYRDLSLLNGDGTVSKTFRPLQMIIGGSDDHATIYSIFKHPNGEISIGGYFNKVVLGNGLDYLPKYIAHFDDKGSYIQSRASTDAPVLKFVQFSTNEVLLLYPNKVGVLDRTSDEISDVTGNLPYEKTPTGYQGEMLGGDIFSMEKDGDNAFIIAGSLVQETKTDERGREIASKTIGLLRIKKIK